MLKALAYVVVMAGALLVLPHLISGVAVAGVYTAVIVALIWGLAMLFVKPVLSVLTLPVNLLTLGLFSFVLNALLFWFLSTFIQGFYVAGFVPALEGSVLLAVVGWALHLVF